MTDPDDGETTYTYNVGNRLTSLTNPLDETTDFTYDTLGRLTRQDNENGTYDTWTFDDAGRASAVATKKSDDTTILSLSYTRDNVGNPTSVSEALLDTDDQTTHNATLTYTYDDLHRLTSEKRTTSQPIWYEYTMDAAGNRTQFVEKDQQGQVVGTTNATYSDDNRLLTYGNLAYDWDDNGNLTSKTVNQVETTYGWDYENKLTSLTDGSTLSFTYNGDGLRQSKTVDGTTTRFVYSGLRLLQETNSGGTTQATYTLAPMGGEWEPLVAHRKSGASRFYAFDVLGTTRALTDGSEDVAAVFTDDAWGNVLSATDPSATPHQYVGRYGYYANGTSGLMLLTQRYYDGGVGRFVSEDPVRSTTNWTSYVGGCPCVGMDPAGLERQCPHGGCDNSGGMLGSHIIDVGDDGTWLPHLPPVIEGKEVVAGTAAVALCNATTGRPYVIYDQSAYDTLRRQMPSACADYIYRCLIVHERRHESQIANCCARYSECVAKAMMLGSMAKADACRQAYKAWEDKNRNRFECDAYYRELDCIARRERSLNCAQFNFLQLLSPRCCGGRRMRCECCAELRLRRNDIRGRVFQRYGCQPLTPPPFGCPDFSSIF